MGLDLYAGPLTRYYAGLWKTVIQQMGEAQGREVQVLRPGGTGPSPSADEAREAVVAWQRGLRDATGVEGLDWAESATGDYFTDKPDWDGYGAVMLLAAHDEFPDIPLPAAIGRNTALPDASKHPLSKRVDEVYLGKRSGGLVGRLFGRMPEPPPATQRRYPHLLMQAELWLPAELAEVFEAPDPIGSSYVMGSAVRLLAELESLNLRTLNGDEATIEDWAKDGPPEDGDFDTMARFGLALLLQGARYAVEHRVPLKLDY